MGDCLTISHMCIALSAWWMGEFLCFCSYWSGWCVGVSHVWPKMYATTKGNGNRVWQKQLPEVFCKRMCSQKFLKIHRKTTVPESFFLNKVAGPHPATLLKKDSGTGAFLWILEYFQEHLLYRTPLDDCFWYGNSVFIEQLGRWNESWVRVETKRPGSEERKMGYFPWLVSSRLIWLSPGVYWGIEENVLCRNWEGNVQGQSWTVIMGLNWLLNYQFDNVR